MLNKKMLVIRISWVVFFIFIMVITLKKNLPETDHSSVDIADEYELQLLNDTELQQKVEDFLSSKNILEMFNQHKEQLQLFADQCYSSRERKDSFFVKNIDGKRLYFCWSDIPNSVYLSMLEENMAIQKGKYDHITAFMDYAIEYGLAFRDWMIAIVTPSPVNEDRFLEKETHHYGALLSIIIYEGRGLEISFLYSPYEDVDYTYEYYDAMDDGPPGGRKVIRIDSHWYYEYVVTQWSNAWHPDLRTLGFFNEEMGKVGEMETEQLTDNPPHTAPLSPVEIFLHYTVIVGVPIMVVLFIYVLIRFYLKCRRSTK